MSCHRSWPLMQTAPKLSPSPELCNFLRSEHFSAIFFSNKMGRGEEWRTEEGQGEGGGKRKEDVSEAVENRGGTGIRKKEGEEGRGRLP